MPDQTPSLNLLPVPGIQLGVASAGIKKPGRRDLVVMEICADANCASVFTRNAFCAAPVVIAKRHIQQTSPRYLLINTGNANAGTGDPGLQSALQCCKALAEQVGCEPEQILPFSTGVIGEPLPVNKIIAALPAAISACDENAWEAAAYGIMTTDLVPKGVSRSVRINGADIIVTGIAKGSGMIRPDMATMLAYIATDAAVDATLLQQCLRDAVEHSFNRITVDGDTSTNDACLLIATGQSDARVIDQVDSDAYHAFSAALTEVCEELAKAIVRDGEGATKLVTIDVTGGATSEECRRVAFTVAHSPLVKTALFASDPNWGRILAAVGRAGIPDLDIRAIQIMLGEHCIVRNGARAEDYSEDKGQSVMQRSEIDIVIELGRGTAHERVWTCDFSYDYVRINAEYRT